MSMSSEKYKRYDYLSKVLDILNDMVGFYVLPRIDYDTFKNLQDPCDIINYISEHNKNDNNQRNSLNTQLIPTEDHYINYYASHASSLIQYHDTTLVDVYCKFDTSYVRANDFSDTLLIMNSFLTPEQLLISIIRPEMLCEDSYTSDMLLNSTKYIQIITNLVSNFEYNLINFEDDLQNHLDYYNHFNTIDYSYISNMLYSIKTSIRDTYNEYKHRQLIEVLMPQFNNKNI